MTNRVKGTTTEDTVRVDRGFSGLIRENTRKEYGRTSSYHTTDSDLTYGLLLLCNARNPSTVTIDRSSEADRGHQWCWRKQSTVLCSNFFGRIKRQ